MSFICGVDGRTTRDALSTLSEVVEIWSDPAQMAHAIIQLCRLFQ